MNLAQIEFLRSLDPNKQYGTIQRLLQEGNLQTTPFENVAKVLLHAMMQERDTLLREARVMRKVLQANGLYTNELLETMEG
jgi:2-hydroxychromene-2-carboxylate isomerase